MTPVSDNNNHQQPTGNLEELFRQKFAEAELTPRADVWERLDHELLLRENQGYRRRLVGYRRLAAAACAVATLGFGGWLAQRNLTPTGTNSTASVINVEALRQASGAAGTVAAHQRTATNSRGGQLPTATDAAAANAATNSGATQATNDASGMASSVAAASRAHAATQQEAAEGSLAGRALAAIRQAFGGHAPAGVPQPRTMPAGMPRSIDNGATGIASRGAISPNGQNTEAASPLVVAATAASAANWTEAGLEPVAARLRGAALGGRRPDSLKAALVSAPALLASQDVEKEQESEKSAVPSRWRWRGGYSAQRFAPNVSSSLGGGIALRSAPLTFNSYAPTTPEPTQLQPGLAHRAQFGAAIPLGRKHWTLLTGAELTSISGNTAFEVAPRNTAGLANMPADRNGKTLTGRYHLTTVGMPVQVRYEGRKQGWGVYAAVGAAVNVLMRNRTAVGTQSATDDGSYRRVLGSARGSAGVRYAAGNWQLNVGPEAEAGLTTLNANPTETWGKRTRPYAVGLSASVEFGGGKAELAP
ncbi:outer membrane beta-barrel protein [Hymenobacter sp. CRA2]|uniref:outer membrane beta-barrel protein n=1 Tax=Hymenobacter sp. CRA2 TaxID=1955620 RepID=UPI00098F7926|nr:outer membrane beta-barrel protein [Hymenobacter sp. CRA2]OON70463.1 hypothetical protein B0919_00050 [Hymenobacter sp. CRA2]